jgi:hypothetical protein
MCCPIGCGEHHDRRRNWRLNFELIRAPRSELSFDEELFFTHRNIEREL